MRSRRFVVLVVLVVAGAVLAAQAPSPRRDRHVIVISLDGLPAYVLDDPAVPLPTLRALAREGAKAEAMRPVNPTVTWPNHTTMVTGVMPERHGLLYNGLPVRREPGRTGSPVRIEAHVDQRSLVQAPTVYDLAFAAGLTTAQVDWVAIERAPTLTYEFQEYSHPEAPIAREMVAAGVLSEADLATFSGGPITFRDEVWTRAGEFLITTHRPNLLLFHLLATDSMQHQYGTRSLAQQAAFALADTRVGRLIDACRRAGILADTTFVVVSDHGFKSYTHRVRGNVVLRDRGLADAAWVIAEGGTAMVYLTGPGDTRTREAVTHAFDGLEGVADVLAPSDYARYGLPSPMVQPRMADLVLVAHDGYAFVDGVDGAAVESLPAGVTLGAHGYLNTDPDLRAVFIAAGAGVVRGARLGVVSPLDVAPTVAAWLGLRMPNVDGRVLTEIVE